jgi:hypothetical protein
LRAIEIGEIRSIAEYELERATWRPQVMTIKDRRRIRVGDHLTFLFENRETVRYQIQEMMRIERIVKAEEIAHEVATYNELIPGPGELSASLLIEYETPAVRAVMLHDLLGLEWHVWMVVDGMAPAPARFDERQIASDRVSAVQYVKFPLSREAAAAWKAGAAIVVDHPAYTATRKLTAAELAELAADLE